MDYGLVAQRHRLPALGKKLVGKAKGDVVDDFRFLVGQQRLIVAARWQHTVGAWWCLLMGSMGRMGLMIFIIPMLSIILIGVRLLHYSLRLVTSMSTSGAYFRPESLSRFGHARRSGGSRGRRGGR